MEFVLDGITIARCSPRTISPAASLRDMFEDLVRGLKKPAIGRDPPLAPSHEGT